MHDEAPAPGAATPDVPGGLGMRALRNTILILVVRVISRIIALVAVIIIGNYLDPTRFGEMQTAVRLKNGVGVKYGLGVFVDSQSGHRFLDHGGTIGPGASSAIDALRAGHGPSPPTA